MISSLEDVAFGPLAMRPDEYWTATPAEIRAAITGWKWRREREHERDAWMLANLIQPWTKRRLRPAMFLGGGMKQHEEDKKVKLRRMLDEAKRRAEA